MTYLVYILKSENYSYVGMTNDFFKRWRQHNKEIKGGAKYTRKYRPWKLICYIEGFINKRQFVFILYSIYVTAVTYVGTEASANRSFIILVFISILPDYLNHYFNSKKTNNIDSSIKVI